MFEQATRMKLRFDSPQGLLSVEDLWDLPLTSTRGANLNDIAKSLNRSLKNQDDDFVTPVRDKNTTLQLAFDIVKHIIEFRLAEQEASRLEVERRNKKQRILELIAKKQDEHLAGRSIEELQTMVNDL